MSHPLRGLAATLVLCGAAAAAWAQSGVAALAAAGTDSSGLARAQRQAANPMRMILEAGRARPRAAEARIAADGAAVGVAADAPRAPAAARAGGGVAGADVAAASSTISVVVQLSPASLSAIAVGPDLAPLEPVSGQRAAPLVLDALRSLPWPDATEAPAPGSELPARVLRVAQAEG